MHTIETKYLGELRTENKHVRSGSTIITDAPIDNKGRGEAFSPTDLVATAVCDCILTIAGIMAEERNFSIEGAKATVTKIMAKTGVRRISEVIVDADFSMCNLSEKHKAIIRKIPDSCPVALSLHPEIKQTINFKF